MSSGVLGAEGVAESVEGELQAFPARVPEKRLSERAVVSGVACEQRRELPPSGPRREETLLHGGSHEAPEVRGTPPDGERRRPVEPCAIEVDDDDPVVWAQEHVPELEVRVLHAGIVKAAKGASDPDEERTACRAVRVPPL